MHCSRRMELVQTPMIPIIGELIRDHPGTISLGQGVVHYPPPPQAFEQLQRFAADADNHKYKLVGGIPELIEAIAVKLQRNNAITPPPPSAGDGDGHTVIVTGGSNMGFINAVLAITDPGDEVILPRPYYFNHEMAIRIADARPILIDTDADRQLMPERIAAAITSRTRAVVTVSPNNPAGTVYPRDALAAVNDLCHRHGIYHISDEAYEYFTYEDARHFSPASLPGSAGHTISLFSLSKAYGMASWRIGYMLIPDRLVMAVKKIQDTIQICPPVISQYAAVGALAAGRSYCHRFVKSLSEVRQLVLDELAGLGGLCRVPPAQGAFYCLIELDLAMDPMHLAQRLIREHGVAAIPGHTFGIARGCHLRIAYGALQKQTVAEGMGRLVRGLEAIAANP